MRGACVFRLPEIRLASGSGPFPFLPLACDFFAKERSEPELLLGLVGFQPVQDHADGLRVPQVQKSEQGAATEKADVRYLQDGNIRFDEVFRWRQLGQLVRCYPLQERLIGTGGLEQECPGTVIIIIIFKKHGSQGLFADLRILPLATYQHFETLRAPSVSG